MMISKKINHKVILQCKINYNMLSLNNQKHCNLICFYGDDKFQFITRKISNSKKNLILYSKT